MLKAITSLLRSYFFWICIFFIERLVFVAYFYPTIFPISTIQFLKIFFFGIRMDASMAGYICAIPLLFFSIRWFVPTLFISGKIYKAYVYTVLTICALLTIINLNIYREWGTKLPYRAI